MNRLEKNETIPYLDKEKKSAIEIGMVLVSKPITD
ncbi:hypothetical protein CLV99_3206 [Sphingobacterium yanglingense]|uniref:Uncharacterized protein n=1 Tax=Sphingobacterium yanglingense TaxID=1437280 RepID=A0A4R6WF05_9SPHI|nr:hypothetical protein CLV99_3206 [Sphingobacterium yanglingense]